MAISIPKFRPYLSAPEIQYLLGLCKQQSSPNFDLIKRLEFSILKISSGHNSPSYISTPAPTIQEKLGFTSPSHVSFGIPEDHITPARFRYSCYLKWAASPESCNSLEIERAMEHRFENDMMTDEEESTYLFSISKSTQG